MSLFKWVFCAGFACCLFMLLYGCSVEPLYRQKVQRGIQVGSQMGPQVGSQPGGTALHGKHAGVVSPDLAAKFATVVVEEPSDRFGQMVRNRLLFLMYGNGSKPSVPVYQLSLHTSVATHTSVQVEIYEDPDGMGRSSVGTVISRASYMLRDMNNVVVAQGKGAISASFDRFRQEYATVQAEENAQKRVAEELAEQIFMLLSKDLAKL
ncbi:LPS assembly lipoprotein LptE [Bartonella sp. WD16.2]|uniref:LPS assembly lipoprotein LptE n=1 Tax=Bartonella sp. WD16.2 TaxID=1933904 RepID=UPI00099B071E|nr:LPS assembly lipoprotein LptE [Bartonella sp. WD16.2]AQX20462.1 LPS-assembly lipoprotein [Bartonella sp. WD16.2]